MKYILNGHISKHFAAHFLISLPLLLEIIALFTLPPPYAIKMLPVIMLTLCILFAVGCLSAIRLFFISDAKQQKRQATIAFAILSGLLLILTLLQ